MGPNKEEYSEDTLNLCEEMGVLTLNREYNDLIKKVSKKEDELKNLLNEKENKILNQLLDGQSELIFFTNYFYYRLAIKVSDTFDFMNQYGLKIKI